MALGELSAHDRWVVLSCLGASLVAAVVVSLVYPVAFLSTGSAPFVLYAARAGAAVPALAALVAVVLTRAPLVGFGIYAIGAVAMAVLGMIGFTARAETMIGPLGVVSLLITSVVGAVPLLAADLIARRGPFTVAWGALAGLAVAVLRGSVPLFTLMMISPPDQLRGVVVGFVLAEALVPGVLLVVTGALAGLAAARRRERQPG